MKPSRVSMSKLSDTLKPSAQVALKNMCRSELKVAIIQRATWSRSSGVSSFVMPQSSSTGLTPPSLQDSTKMLPGCGSPWTRPSWKTSKLQASRICLASPATSVPGGSLSTSVTFQPSINSIVSTRRVQRPSIGSGHFTSTELFARASPARRALRASRLKSASSRLARRHSRMRGVTSGAVLCFTRAFLAMYSMHLRSTAIICSTPLC
mmetsp:Transcript_136758/g.354645  ORF Transcript_136758/g.354645 Transcript_136758/m.354645 type:complete len:208 (+) Transcript_136758:2626-3249(+)